jgi:predicted RNA-binding Zn-ribbon protein involved in translation (DUF1610 family)
MSALERRVRALEQRLLPADDAAPGEAEARWRAAVNAAAEEVLTHMPADRAQAVLIELQCQEPPSSAITRRVLELVLDRVPQSWEWEHQIEGCQCSQHYRDDGPPLVLPEAVCALLEVQPDAEFSYFNCRDCGYESGERSWPEWAALRQARATVPADRAYFQDCPHCGGPVGWRAYQCARQYRQAETSTA